MEVAVIILFTINAVVLREKPRKALSPNRSWFSHDLVKRGLEDT
jgi:hypothetical protein